jgi:hypothetical protein
MLSARASASVVPRDAAGRARLVGLGMDLSERDVVIVGGRSSATGHSLDVVRIFRRHLFEWDLDDDAVKLVQSKLAALEAEELGLNFELAGLVVPDSSLALGRTWSEGRAE